MFSVFTAESANRQMGFSFVLLFVRALDEWSSTDHSRENVLSSGLSEDETEIWWMDKNNFPL